MAGTLRARGGIAALILLAAAAIAILVYLSERQDWQSTPPSPATAEATQVPPPAFDVVRVDPQGNMVIAGRGAPGATITIRSGSTVLGSTSVDASGAFAFLGSSPLHPGAQELSLTETMPDGSTINGTATASVNVPQPGSGAPLSVLSGPNGSQVMSGQAAQPGTLAMGSVDYDANGHAILSGTAPPGAHLHISLGNQNLGDLVAGKDGTWKLTVQVPQNSGMIALNATDAAGDALPTVSAPFALETLPTALAAGHVIIVPGQNLWLIARHVYGHGNLYTLIYNANTQQIHNPDLIFPGQAFAVPHQ